MHPFVTPVRIAGAIALSAAAAALAAEPSALQTPTSRYQQERATCLSGLATQDRETCLREAGAALQEARRGELGGAPTDYGRNRLARCDVHTDAQDRAECVRRMTGGTTSGSVEGGGIYRELVTREPGRAQ